jgi:hypothetical protein
MQSGGGGILPALALITNRQSMAIFGLTRVLGLAGHSRLPACPWGFGGSVALLVSA